MNENDLNVLLDYFVGGLDPSESANVITKINSNPQWEKSYKQLSKIFGRLSTLKEQDNQQPAPDGLAHRTFQKILDLEKSPSVSSDYVAQRESSSPAVPESASKKRSATVKPSILAMCACVGFLCIFLPSLTFFTGSKEVTVVPAGTAPQLTQTAPILQPIAQTNAPSNNSPGFTFCSNSPSEMITPIQNVNPNSFTIRPTDTEIVDLSPHSVPVQNNNKIEMSCPDNVVVFASQAEGQPIIIVPQNQQSLEINNVKVPVIVNANNVNIVVPVNYQK